jgi:hypothetical protein
VSKNASIAGIYFKMFFLRNKLFTANLFLLLPELDQLKVTDGKVQPDFEGRRFSLEGFPENTTKEELKVAAILQNILLKFV